VVSAVLREDGEFALRLFNASPEPVQASIELGDRFANGWTVDLRGRFDAAFSGALDLRPWEIATLRIDR
jgi:hypothetical protein